MKGQLNLHKQLSFVWDETHSVDTTSMAFYDTQNFPWGFPRKHSNALHVRKSYSGRSRAHLAVLQASNLLCVIIYNSYYQNASVNDASFTYRTVLKELSSTNHVSQSRIFSG